MSRTDRRRHDRAPTSAHQQLIPAVEESPEQAAYRRMLEHGSSCRTCLAVNDAGENANRPCETGGRLYEEYLKARRNPV